MRMSFFKVGVGLLIIGMIFLSLIYYEGDRNMKNFSLKPSDSAEMNMEFVGKDIGYYKIFIPEFSGSEVFVQILDQNHNIISDDIVATKMSVNYFNFETSGTYFVKVTNISDEQLNIEVEFGDTNGREMIIPGIITLAGGIMVVIALYIKLRDYRTEQPDENIS